MMPPTKPPRWFTALSKVVGENPKNAEFQLASVSPDGAPHVRTHIHRAFLAPAAHPSHPLLLTSTDVRTPKVVQLLHEPRVEALFWLQHTQEQFRLAARATLVPAPAHVLHGPATAGVPKLLGGRLAPDGIDWEARRRAMFDEMSGHMKASWCRPPPGQKMPGSGGYDEAKKWPERLPKLDEAKTDEDKKLLEEALGNFAIVILEPLDVDYVELGVVPNQRTRFIRPEHGDEWQEEILVP